MIQNIQEEDLASQDSAAEHAVKSVTMRTKLVTWAFFFIILALVMQLMTIIVVPDDITDHLALTTVLATLVGVPVFLLLMLGISALCAAVITTMNKVFSFSRLYWLTCMASMLSILNTALSLYFISIQNVHPVFMTVLSTLVSVGIVLGYGFMLPRLARVANKPRSVIVGICLTYTVLSAALGVIFV